MLQTLRDKTSGWIATVILGLLIVPFAFFGMESYMSERVDNYVARRLRIWLMRRRGKRGPGYRQYSDQFLYETLGLIRLLPTSTDRANAKV